jgi:NADPH-dependent 2,4-dienoyl-CoA reductase/sulfur reductase-like enzyme
MFGTERIAGLRIRSVIGPNRGYAALMTEPRVIVVGSGPAGVSAAEAYREHNDETPVCIVSTDPALPYTRPPLSKEFLRGATDDVAMHPDEWYAERRIDRINARVDHIDTRGRFVTVDGTRHEYLALVVACGSAPTGLPVPGGERAHQLRSLDDAGRLRTDAAQAESAVVIGAGFIGCEAAASLAMRGVPVTLVAPDDAPQAKRLGHEAGERLRDLVTASGARYVGGVAVEALHDGAVKLDNGVTVDCDLVLAATGVDPQSGIAEAAGLEMAESRVLVGADMRTSAPDVFAAGDVAFAFNPTAGRHLAVEHWQDAVDQGAIAGAVAAGARDQWDAVPGFWTTIGAATVKYHAWGDGYDNARLIDHGDGFTVWYERAGTAVGVLTHNADGDYDLGESLIAGARPLPAGLTSG